MSGSPHPFTHGVASFEPTSSGVLLWTRATDAEALGWVVATDASFRDVVASGRVALAAETDHTATVDVDGLEPATTYWYRFTAGATHSPVGRTRTLPATGTDPFRILTVCCARYSVAPLGVYRAVAEASADLVLHLGDYIYEDDGSDGPRDHDPPTVATTLDDYRRRYAQIRSDTDAQAMHARHPVVAIWDDHDLADNAWRTGAKAHDPEQHGSWDDRVAAASRAHQEWLPSRLRDPGDTRTTWRSVAVGDLAELVLLDTRWHGRDRHAGDDESPDLHDPARSLLGDEQRAWLDERLADQARPWSLVASGVVVNELELEWPRSLRWIDRLLPNGYAVLDGRVIHDDQWDGYPAERSRLVRAVADRAAGGGRTVILSGDVHSSWAFAGPCDERTGEPVAVEFTTPAVSSAAMGRAHYPGMWRVLDRVANRLDHVEWADVTERGYAAIDVTAEAVTATWWFVHPYADDPTADAVAVASFRTRREDWPPALEAVAPAPPGPRPALGHELPPRPPDLRRLRWRRRARLAALPTAAAAAAGGALLQRSLRSGRP